MLATYLVPCWPPTPSSRPCWPPTPSSLQRRARMPIGSAHQTPLVDPCRPSATAAHVPGWSNRPAPLHPKPYRFDRSCFSLAPPLRFHCLPTLLHTTQRLAATPESALLLLAPCKPACFSNPHLPVLSSSSRYRTNGSPGTAGASAAADPVHVNDLHDPATTYSIPTAPLAVAIGLRGGSGDGEVLVQPRDAASSDWIAGVDRTATEA